MTYQTGKGDFTLLYNGKIYKFPTEQELDEFIKERVENHDNPTDDVIVVR